MNKEQYFLEKYDLRDLGLGFIYPPTVREIIERKNNYDILVRPFMVNYEEIKLKDNNKLKSFDLLFSEDINTRNILSNLFYSLSILYKTSNISIISDENYFSIKIDTNTSNDLDEEKIYYLTRDNFIELCVIIRKMFWVQLKNQDENVPEFTNKKQKEAWERLQKHRLKTQNKEEDTISIYNIINLVVASHTEFNRTTYSNILDMTIYELFHSYKIIQEKERYSYNKLISTSGMVALKNRDYQSMIEEWQKIGIQ